MSMPRRLLDALWKALRACPSAIAEVDRRVAEPLSRLEGEVIGDAEVRILGPPAPASILDSAGVI